MSRKSLRSGCVCEPSSSVNLDASLIKDASNAYVTNPLREACRSFFDSRNGL